MVNPAERTPRILAADDEKDSLKVLSHILLQEGFEVVLAEDGNQALDILLHEEIDLALLDVRMPHWDGFALCRIVRSNPRTRFLPVVLVTGLTGVEDRIEGIEAGANDFLHKPYSRDELVARLRSLLKLKYYTDELEHAEGVLFSLALSIEGRDPYTSGHCERLSRYSVAVAERLGLPEEDRVALRRAGAVHDLGKIAIPDQILLKPSPLTPEERKVMEQHPIVGEQICQPLRSFRQVLPIIRHHHEKMDGSGYPDRVEGEQIPLTARVLTVVDVFDALTTDRPYRKALLPGQALANLHEEADLGRLDGRLVELFASLIRDPALALLKKS